jgi:hypothetical protein
VGWGPHEASLWGSPNLKDVWRSRPCYPVARHDHPLHLHTFHGIPTGLSSWRRRRRRSSLALRGL